MRQLKTTQTKEVLNKVYAMDEKGPGGANHKYLILSPSNQGSSKEQIIEFQKGPRNEIGSQNGVVSSDLLEIVGDILKSFQEGPYSCEENEKALEHVEIALFWLNERVEDRIAKNKLGKYIK